MDIITFALCKGASHSAITNNSISVNSNGELEVNTSLPFIGINMETGYLETDSDIFSVNRDGYLMSEV